VDATTTDILVFQGDSIPDVKLRITASICIPGHQQRLFFNDEALAKFASVGQLMAAKGLQQGSFILVVRDLNARMEPIFLQFSSGGVAPLWPTWKSTCRCRLVATPPGRSEGEDVFVAVDLRCCHSVTNKALKALLSSSESGSTTTAVAAEEGVDGANGGLRWLRSFAMEFIPRYGREDAGFISAAPTSPWPWPWLCALCHS
jgi:hypothetical protein